MSYAYDDQNVFAKILRGEIPNKTVLETTHSLAFADIQPQAPTHVLVIPRKGYVAYDDFIARASAEEVSDFFAAVAEVIRISGVSEAEGGTGFRLLTNAGPDGRQEVPHFHMHVVGGRDLGRILPKMD